MLNNLKQLSKIQKLRMISLGIITILICLCVLLYAWGTYRASSCFSPVDDMYVDGEDVSLVTNLVVMGANGVMYILNAIWSVVAVILISLILLIPWRCLTIRKTSVIDLIEYKTAGILLAIFISISFAAGLFITHFKHVIFVGILVLMAALSFVLIALLPLKTASDCTQTQEQSE